MNLINVKINGQDYQFDKPYTIIQACEIIGIEIPRFCYHKRLKIAGNCRMCLVRVASSPKPVASCAFNITNNMVIETDTDEVNKMRENVMEFLLINHPLDCPICDQGGECDLQDQAFKYGKGYSEFKEEKRVVEEKNFGPLIKTNMTRCIHCARCIRFMDDIAMHNELGTINRGENLEIINAIDGMIRSEVSGNIIDLCPVGALTGKPYAYTARSWELNHVQSIDLTDGMGSNIFLDVRESQVMRILPRENDFINEEWISDKARFHYDGIRYQRIGQPYIRDNSTRKLKPISWNDAISVIVSKLDLSKPSRVGSIIGQTADLESIIMMKKIFDKIGSNNLDFRSDLSYFSHKFHDLFRFNSSFDGLENSDFCMIIGANIRFSAPVLNLRINRLISENNLKLCVLGEKYNTSNQYEYLGNDSSVLEEIFKNEAHPIHQKFLNSKNPIIIFGEDILQNQELAQYNLYWMMKIAEKFGLISKNNEKFDINFLSSYAHTGSAVLSGFFSDENMLLKMKNGFNFDVLFLLCSDEIDFSNIKSNFIIYQGHHADISARHSDLILPGLCYSEKDALYVNIEGRLQKAQRAVSLIPSHSKKDVEILIEIHNKLSSSINSKISKDDLYFEINQNYQLNSINSDIKFNFNDFINEYEIYKNSGNYKIHRSGFYNKNFYKTSPILRNSPIMDECSKLYKDIFE